MDTRQELNFNLIKDSGANWSAHNFSSNQETRRAKGSRQDFQHPDSQQNFEPENDRDRSSSPFTFTKSKPDDVLAPKCTENGFRNFFTAKTRFCAEDQKNDRYKETLEESILEKNLDFGKNPELLA
jgi:hypothetical protein